MIHNQALDSIQHYHQIYIKEVSFQQARQYIYIFFSLAFDRRETETVKKNYSYYYSRVESQSDNEINKEHTKGRF